MTDFVEWLPTWREVRAHFENGRSVLLHAPRNAGKSRILMHIASDYAPSIKATCVSLTSIGNSVTGMVDYAELWDSVTSQLGRSKNAVDSTVSDKIGFWSAFAKLLKKRRRPIFVLLRGARRGNEPNHRELIGLFHGMVAEGAGRSGLKVIATDDYSCLFYVKQLHLASATPFFENVYYNSLDGDDLERCLRGVIENDTRHAAEALGPLLAEINSYTGGHPGLVAEMIDYLRKEQWKSSPEAVRQHRENAFARSDVLINIAKALEEDIEGYCRTALEYTEPMFPEVNNPRVNLLQEVGVLQRMSTNVRLCPGAVTELITQMQHRSRAPFRVHALVEEAGVRRLEPGELELDDDDFVIVHLSDLHVGKNYRYRLTWSGNGLNPGQSTASELLGDDLRSPDLDLHNRVDALLITGDFVDTGIVEEFRLARDAIEEMLKDLNLSPEQLVLIPGNHDVQWDPVIFARKGPNPRVSMDNYQEFAKYFKVTSDSPARVIRIKSRGGKRVLQVIGIDSNGVEGPETGGIGFVSRETLSEVSRLLEADKPDDGVLVDRVMLVHHHILPCSSVPLEQAQTKNVSVMANAAEVLDSANRWGVELILHGHEHQPMVTVARRWPVGAGGEFNAMIVIGAGSFSVKREQLGPFARNHYYVICLRKDDIIVRSRCIGDNGTNFVGHNDVFLRRRRSQGAPGSVRSTKTSAKGSPLRSNLAQ